MHRVLRVLQQVQLTSAPPEATVFDVAVTMTKRQVGAIPILDGERIVGIFSERDLMQRVVVTGRDPKTTRVSEVMTRDVVTTTLDESVEASLEKMRRNGCRHLPVVDKGRVLGVISMRDLLRDELAEQGEEIEHLRTYLHQTPN
jgi:CBS domain-containing protein